MSSVLFSIFIKFPCAECDHSYESKSALAKHERIKHSENEYVYFCQICSKDESKGCMQAHTMMEHYRQKHNMNITSEYAQTLREKRTNAPKTSKPKRPKRVHEVIQCKCGQTNKGFWVFKRHVNNNHDSQNYDEFA